MQILLVEDDEDLVFLLENMFRTIKGTNTTVCRSVDKALAALTGDYLPDVAIVDFRAGGSITSVDLCVAIRERRTSCSIFLMSGVARSFMESSVRDVVDVQGFLEKPFNIPKLLSRLKRDCDELARRRQGDRPVEYDERDDLALTRHPPSSDAQIDTYYTLLKQDPNDASVRQLLAFSLYTAGRFAEALKEYAALDAAGVCTFLTEYYGGHTCARLHRYAQAVERWERALKVAPSNDVVARLKQRIAAAREMQAAQRKLVESGPFQKLDI